MPLVKASSSHQSNHSPSKKRKGGHSHGANMSEGLVTPLKSVLTCGGCGQQYNDTGRRPKFLACFHTACLACISKGFHKGKVQCPTCGRPTEGTSATSLPDNTQLCTIIINMSSLNLYESPNTVRDTCPTHAARINFWCDTCRMPLCRDCTVLAHRASAGHKVRDHDDAINVLKNEARQAIADTKTLQEETRRLRLDHRKYLIRQIEACKAFEKNLKTELKNIDNDKREDCKALETLETDLPDCCTLVTLQQAVERAGKLRMASAQDFSTAKTAVAEKMLSLGKLNRSSDDLDTVGDSKSLDSCSPSSPLHLHLTLPERRSKSLAGRLLHHNGKNKQDHIYQQYSVEAPPTYVQPNPKIYFDISVQGILQTCRVVCELRPDKAPNLCENFIRLCTGKKGFGFKNTKIFRCLPGWWIQGGDFESNDGEGGKSAMDDELIPAEKTDLEPRPGALEMLCVSTDTKGGLMVGSQFFIHVKKYSYTHVFGYVLDGLDIIERISQLGSSAEVYRPSKEITIVDCGILKNSFYSNSDKIDSDLLM